MLARFFKVSRIFHEGLSVGLEGCVEAERIVIPWTKGAYSLGRGKYPLGAPVHHLERRGKGTHICSEPSGTCIFLAGWDLLCSSSTSMSVASQCEMLGDSWLGLRMNVTCGVWRGMDR